MCYTFQNMSSLKLWSHPQMDPLLLDNWYVEAERFNISTETEPKRRQSKCEQVICSNNSTIVASSTICVNYN